MVRFDITCLPKSPEYGKPRGSSSASRSWTHAPRQGYLPGVMRWSLPLIQRVIFSTRRRRDGSVFLYQVLKAHLLSLPAQSGLAPRAALGRIHFSRQDIGAQRQIILLPSSFPDHSPAPVLLSVSLASRHYSMWSAGYPGVTTARDAMPAPSSPRSPPSVEALALEDGPAVVRG